MIAETLIQFLIGWDDTLGSTSAGVFGTLPGWLTLVALIAGVWKISQSGGGAAVSELTAANKVLEQRLQATRDEMGGKIRDLMIENASLSAKTDITLALKPVLEEMAAHEERSAQRAEVLVETGRSIQEALKAIGNAFNHESLTVVQKTVEHGG